MHPISKRIPLLILLGAVLPVASCKKKESSATTDSEASGSASENGKTTHTAPHPALTEYSKKVKLSEKESDIFKTALSRASTDEIRELVKLLSPRRNDPSSGSYQTFAAAIEELARRDPHHVMDWFIPAGMTPNERGLMEVSRVLAETHPDIIGKWLLENHLTCQQSVSMAFHGLSEVDPGRALALFNQCTVHPMYGDSFLPILYFRYASSDPAAAVTLAEQTLKGRQLSAILATIGNQLSTTDPEAALHLAEKITDSISRDSVISATTLSMLDKDPVTTLTRLKAMAPGDLASILRKDMDARPLFETLLRKHPEETCQLIATLLPTGHNKRLFQQAVSTLASTRPESTEELIEKMPIGNLKTELTGTYYRTLAGIDPQAALIRIQSLQDPARRDPAFAAFGEIVGKHGIDHVLTVSRTLDAADRKAVVSSALPYIIFDNPQGTSTRIAAIIAEQQLDKGTSNQAYYQLGRLLTLPAGEKATTWLDTVPDEYQARAMSGLASRIAETDIQGLSVYLGTLPKDARWEAGVAELVRTLDHSDKEMATRWRQALRDAGY